MAERPLEVAIAAGGTAGHINPALALAEELRDRGHHVTFYGQPARKEGELVPQAGFELVGLNVTGFDREAPWTAVTALVRMARAQMQLNKRFKQVGAPDVAIGFGAYVELPLINWCAAHKVPCLIHEQNSVPGLANKLSAKKCARVCVALPAARPAFEKSVPEEHLLVVGNPVRKSVLEASRERGRAGVGARDDECVLLVFGGSLGAHHINEGVVDLKQDLLERENLRIVHSTGKDDYEWVTEHLALTPEEAERWLVLDYIDDMGDKLAAADLVLSRAGATSIAEIAALAVPSLLVPYPLATADHQTTNARFLVDAGAARMVADDMIGTYTFTDALLHLIDSPETCAEMRAAAQGLGQASAARVLAEAVEDAASGR